MVAHLVLVAGCAGPGMAPDPRQTTISGILADAERGIPLPGAQVSVTKGAEGDAVWHAQSDAEGRYTIDLPGAHGVLRVDFRALGYEAVLRTVDLSEPATIRFAKICLRASDIIASVTLGSGSLRRVYRTRLDSAQAVMAADAPSDPNCSR